MKFRLKVDAEFEAADIDDAVIRLSRYFISIPPQPEPLLFISLEVAVKHVEKIENA